LQQIAGKILDHRLLIEIFRRVIKARIRLIDIEYVGAEHHRQGRKARPHERALLGGDDFVVIVDDAEVEPKQEADDSEEAQPEPNWLTGELVEDEVHYKPDCAAEIGRADLGRG